MNDGNRDADALLRLSLDALRALWRETLKAAPPAHASRDLLVRALLYHTATRGGGLVVRRLHTKLAQLAEGFAGDRDFIPPEADKLRPGTILMRDWNGRRYAVTVTAEGFLFDGKSFVSLSAVAAAITGVKWSGPRFFKLNALGEGKQP